MLPGQLSLHDRHQGPELLGGLRLRHRRTTRIGMAMRMIQYGDADVMIAGGAERGSLADLDGRLLRDEGDVHPQRRSRPAPRGRGTQDRDGFVLGDGAGILVLEEYEHAKARGARIYCELVGFGASADAFHMTAPSENGEGPARCMATAFRDAGDQPGRGRLPQRARHLDAAGRPGRDAGDQARARRPRLQDDGQLDQVDDRPPARRGRRRGGDLLGDGAAHRHHPADHQPGQRRAKAATWTTCRTWRARRRSTWRCPTASASAAPTARWCSSASDACTLPSQQGTAAEGCTSPMTAATASRRHRPARPAPARPGALSGAAGIQRALARAWSLGPAAGACRRAASRCDRDGVVRDAVGRRARRRFPRRARRGMAGALRPARRTAAGRSAAAGRCCWATNWRRRWSRCCALPPARAALPVAMALRCPAAVLRDRGSGELRAVAEAGSEAWLDAHRSGSRARARAARRCRRGRRRSRIDEDAPQRYLDGVARVLDYLAAGDVFQVNLSRGWTRTFDAALEPAALFARLRENNPAPFAGIFAKRRGGRWSAPRRSGWCRCAASVVETRPIAGTRAALSRRRRCRAHPRAGRPSQGARRTRDADRPGAQRPRPRVRAGQRARWTS